MLSDSHASRDGRQQHVTWTIAQRYFQALTSRAALAGDAPYIIMMDGNVGIKTSNALQTAIMSLGAPPKVHTSSAAYHMLAMGRAHFRHVSSQGIQFVFWDFHDATPGPQVTH